ncbi:MAG: PKD repeat protein [Flavobacteriales bacterium]|jgi:PKD repeat protein
MNNTFSKNIFKKLLIFCLFMVFHPISIARTSTARISSDPIDIAGVVTMCANTSIQFGEDSSGGLSSRSWTFEIAHPNTSGANNPLVTYNTTGLFLAIKEATNAFGSDSDMMQVVVNELPSVIISPTPSDILCKNGTVVLTTNILAGKPSFTYSCSPSTGLSSTSLLNASVSGLIANTTYSLTVTDGIGKARANVNTNLGKNISPFQFILP